MEAFYQMTCIESPSSIKKETFPEHMIPSGADQQSIPKTVGDAKSYTSHAVYKKLPVLTYLASLCCSTLQFKLWIRMTFCRLCAGCYGFKHYHQLDSHYEEKSLNFQCPKPCLIGQFVHKYLKTVQAFRSKCCMCKFVPIASQKHI